MRRLVATVGSVLIVAGLTGCHTDMWVQPRVKTLSKSDFFKDGSSARMPVKNTVAWGNLREDEAYYTGKLPTGKYVQELPFELTKDVLLRGRERYDVFCAPCHGKVGDGQGMIAQRGFNQKRPVATLHQDRLRQAQLGYFFETITNGFGVMYSYASRIPVEDRWKIAAYIRALQLSQNATYADVPQEVLPELIEKGKVDLTPKKEAPASDH
ncbi:MAG: cytochrome c [Armatimonadetes bacterium]|nr:cytochrome c [Armatimonadota bacterium]